MPRYVEYAAALALSLAMYSASAHASTIDVFTFTSPEITGPLTAFIAASPTPALSVPGVSFDLSNISTTFEGNTVTGDVTFFTAGGAGGGGTVFGGPELFTGLVTAPTFKLGSFPLSGMADLGNGGVESVTGTLVISQQSPVPEPWPLALTGTGLVLGLIAMQRRRLHDLRSANQIC